MHKIQKFCRKELTAAGAIHIIKARTRLTLKSKAGQNGAYTASPLFPMGGPRRYGMENGGKMTKQRTTPTAKRNHGFTLMEMLIVVAIIAVLVAVAIPTFSSQLHKARVATDWANVRSYYAQLQYDFMETGEINKSYLHEISMAPTGLTSFQLSGQEIKLKAGSIWVAENDGGKTGYNVYYACTMYPHHPHCELTLPMS